MHIKNTYRILSFSICLLIFASCETIIDLDIPQKPPSIVVNTFFNPDSIWSVELSKSQHILDNAALSVITDASVKIFNGSTLVEQLEHTSGGKYVSVSGKFPKANISYRIEVSSSGMNSVDATDIIPAPTEIFSADTGRVSFEGQNYFEVKVGFKDNTSEKNYYNLQVWGIVSQYVYDGFGVIIDTIYYEQPVYFTSNDILFEGEKWFDLNGASFSDNLIQSGTYKASLLIDEYQIFGQKDPGGQKTGGYDLLIIALKSVSESFYKYNRSYKKFQEAQGNPFAQPVQVYNNINSGYGIFAGYSQTEYQIEIK
jgi:hypothetical protein